METRAKLGQEFRVNRITGHVELSDTQVNIHKKHEYVAYKAHVSSQNALISYAGMPQLSVENNLSIIDRSTVLSGNKIATNSEYTLISNASSFTSDTDRVLVTDTFTTALSTQNSVPLFYQHQIPVEHFDSAQGHKILSLSFLDDNFAEVAVAEKYCDFDNGTVFNNLEHSYDDLDRSYHLYYLQYTVKETATRINTYTVLLDNKPIYQQASLDDVSVDGTLHSTCKAYLLEELADGSFLFTLPVVQSYGYRKLSYSRIAILPPVAKDINSPWHVRVSDGKFFATVNGAVYKYHIAEILSQYFTPYMPYKYAQNEPGIVLNKNLISLVHSKVFQSSSEGLYIDVLVYDVDDNLKYAFTTDQSKHGVWAGKDASDASVSYSCLSHAGATYGIRSVDHYWGFLDVQGISLKDTDKVKCFYYYEYSDLEIALVNFNPVNNQGIIDQSVVLFLVPDSVFSSNVKSIYTLVLNSIGQVISSDWPVFDDISQNGHYMFYQEAPDWFKDEYGASNCENFLTTYTVNGGSATYPYLVLGELYVSNTCSATGVELIDVRREGGGIANNSSIRASDDAKRCWDLGHFDGEPYPGAGTFLVEVPVEIMSGATGRFKSDEIRKIVERHHALGVYPVIRAYGIDPRITCVEPGDGTLTIEWTHAAPDVYYNVYISQSKEGTFVCANDTPLAEDTESNTFHLLGLTNNVSYYIFVVGGRYIEGVWTPFSEQIIGPHYPVARGVSTLEYIRCVPGLPRDSNLLGQEFTVATV